MKYSDQVIDWLVEENYTHCFFLAGGNIMHLLDSVRSRMICVPVIHETSAGMAAEYFNYSQDNSKAFALVTAGPGLTNIVTPIAGAWQESRELLVLGGQVKSSDINRGLMRQKGIQEIDGVQLVSSITKVSVRLEEPLPKSKFIELIRTGSTGRPGPVFLEFCLDVQATDRDTQEFHSVETNESPSTIDVSQYVELLAKSERPIFLIGGGVSSDTARSLVQRLEFLNVPIMTTFNGADRINNDYRYYFGRPNTWGQRYSNILIQQSDLIVAVGSRLGLQQTGFNWEEFAPLAQIVQVDIDESELTKINPQIDYPVCMDANFFLKELLKQLDQPLSIGAWLDFCHEVKASLPVIEENTCGKDYVSPYEFWNSVPRYFPADTIFIPSSSGGTFTTAYQAISLSGSQKLISNKSLASMGYGLASAIGAAFANPKSTIILGEGDGGFAQNMQELGTVKAHNLNIKIFIFDNDGYASIRMTQKNYFNGEWIGCDSVTHVGLPNWEDLAKSYGIRYLELDGTNFEKDQFWSELLIEEPVIIRISCDPAQTYFPKISSKISESGKMTSNPLHLMDPALPAELQNVVMRYLN